MGTAIISSPWWCCPSSTSTSFSSDKNESQDGHHYLWVHLLEPHAPKMSNSIQTPHFIHPFPSPTERHGGTAVCCLLLQLLQAHFHLNCCSMFVVSHEPCIVLPAQTRRPSSFYLKEHFCCCCSTSGWHPGVGSWRCGSRDQVHKAQWQWCQMVFFIQRHDSQKTR